MANVINATSTGNGGLVSTGDDSGILNIQTNETTAITVDASQNTTFAGKVTSAGALTLASNGTTTAVTIDTSQNVGIGTTTAKTVLTIQGGGVTGLNTGTFAWQHYQQASSSYTASAIESAISGASASLIFKTNGNWTNGNATEAMRIDSSGRVAIGNTSASSRALWVEQSANQVGMTVKCTNASFGQFVIGCDTSRAADAGFDLYLAQSNGVSQFRVAGNGTIYAQNTSVQSISDVRMKENIVNSTEGLGVINALRPVRFDFKEGFGNNRKNQLGFIAQEMESVFPDAVDVWGKSDDPENPYKSVGPSALIPVLVKAIQELKAINDTQAETINALTARIVALESK